MKMNIAVDYNTFDFPSIFNSNGKLDFDEQEKEGERLELFFWLLLIFQLCILEITMIVHK